MVFKMIWKFSCKKGTGVNHHDVNIKSSKESFTSLANMDSVFSSSQANLPVPKRTDEENEPSPSPSSTSTSSSAPKQERSYMMLIQIVVPFFIAGFGMVGAGILLDQVQHWPLYKEIKEIIVLVPALLGLKGNLEMTLASRLSTQVNLKLVYNKKTIKKAVLGNIFLTQLQSIVVGFLASFVACITEFILKKKFYPANLLVLIGSSVGTASFASLLLGSIIMFIILISERFKINPDNVATPIASSLGDLVTLAILSGFGTLLFILKRLFWIHIVLIIVFVILVPIFAYLCYKNEFVKEVLYQGWAPVIIAMFISSIAGVILEFAIRTYPGVAIYQPVVNGVGGNLVAIYASRLSTSLHKTSEAGKWATWAPKRWYRFPLETFYSKQNREFKTSLILMSLVIPGHVIFFFVIYAVNVSDTRPNLTAQLVLFYLALTFLQVTILMLMCYALVHTVWRLKQNPDNICIPLLTATGDLLGVCFLFFCFYLTFLTGDASVRILGGHTETDDDENIDANGDLMTALVTKLTTTSIRLLR